MASVDLKLSSEALNHSVSVNVILPQDRKENEKLKVLWLLHGMFGDHSYWTRFTNIERYVDDKNVCVVMPAVENSYYTDMVYGKKFFTYVTEELPEILEPMFGLSRKREDNYVAGFSMGGYGTFKMALNYPDMYCMAASLSGALDLEALYKAKQAGDIKLEPYLRIIFGSFEAFKDSNSDLRYMAELRAKEENVPDLFMCCGKEDFLYKMNLEYLAFLKNLNIPVTYEEDDNYEHTWEYWDLKIKRVIEWMGL
jgi:S-formylglutathione hydrolase FrmB